MRLAELSARERARLLHRYERNVLPTPRPQLFQMRRYGWRAEKWPDGNAKRVGSYHLEHHLAGHMLVAAKWDLDMAVRHFVIDIDADDPGHHGKRRRFSDRLSDVCKALKSVPHLILRSSSSRGVHIYGFLDHTCDARELRDAVRGLLAASNVWVASGEVEVWPAATALRLPLGRGSALLDHRGEPLNAAYDTRGRLLRDVTSSVTAFCDFAERHRIPFDKLRSLAGVTHIRSKKKHVSKTNQSQNVRNSRRSYRDRIEEITDGIPAEGMRYDAASIFIWHHFVYEGLSRQKTLRKFERWLLHGDHNSKDLERDPEGTRRRMLQDAARYLDVLAGRVKRGDLIRRSHHVQWTSLLAIIEELRAEHADGWRTKARERLTDQDHLLLTKIRDAWCRDKVAVLVGCLRTRPTTLIVAMPRTALVAIAGGKTRPVEGPEWAAKKLGRSAYKRVLSAARCVGLIELHAGYKPGVRAYSYRVRLPGTAEHKRF